MKTFGSWSGGSFKAARSVITGTFWSWARNATGAASEPASATANVSFTINDGLIVASSALRQNDHLRPSQPSRRVTQDMGQGGANKK